MLLSLAGWRSAGAGAAEYEEIVNLEQGGDEADGEKTAQGGSVAEGQKAQEVKARKGEYTPAYPQDNEVYRTYIKGKAHIESMRLMSVFMWFCRAILVFCRRNEAREGERLPEKRHFRPLP